jgi:hypothetical protein
MPSMLAWINLADTALSVDVSREAEGLGARNLLTEPVADVWRVPNVASGTATDLDITLPAASEIGVIALFAPRDSYIPANYDVRIFGSNVAIGDSDAFFTTFAPLNLAANRGAWWFYPAAPVMARFVKLRFRAGDAAEYLQFGRLWIGPTFRPNVGAAEAGFVRGAGDSGLVERAAISGVFAASRGATYRAPRFTLPLLSDAEADALEDMAGAVGLTRQVLVNARTQRGAKDLILGRLTVQPQPQAIGPDDYSAEISVTEEL